MNSPTDQALAIVRTLAGQEFWGNLTLKFQRGDVVRMTKEESIVTVPNNWRPNDNPTQES